MGAHKRAKTVSGKCHFTPEQRRDACLSFKKAHYRKRNKTYPTVLGCKLRYNATRGRQGDDVWAEAFEDYTAGETTHPSYQGTKPPRGCSTETFKAVVRTWYATYARGGECARGGLKASPLSDTDVALCVKHIGEPYDSEKGSFSHHSSLEDAFKRSPELQQMLQRHGGTKKLSLQRLHNILVEDLKVLTYTKPDTRDVLCDRTLDSRKKAAEQWAGRQPWLKQASPALLGGREVDTYFDQEFYHQFTFMIDAVGMEDGPGTKDQPESRVYGVAHKIWGPQHLKKKPPVKGASKMMFYVVLHPRAGIICGPDLVLTGSRVAAVDKAQKEQLLRQWCVFSSVVRTVISALA